jgi:hypothetical protein
VHYELKNIQTSSGDPFVYFNEKLQRAVHRCVMPKEPSEVFSCGGLIEVYSYGELHY